MDMGIDSYGLAHIALPFRRQIDFLWFRSFRFPTPPLSPWRESALLKPAACGRRSRSYNLAGKNRLVHGKVRNDGVEPVIHSPGIPAAPLLTIHAGHHGQIVWIAISSSVTIHGPKNISRVKVLAFRRTKLACLLLIWKSRADTSLKMVNPKMWSYADWRGISTPRLPRTQASSSSYPGLRRSAASSPRVPSLPPNNDCISYTKETHTTREEYPASPQTVLPPWHSRF